MSTARKGGDPKGVRKVKAGDELITVGKERRPCGRCSHMTHPPIECGWSSSATPPYTAPRMNGRRTTISPYEIMRGGRGRPAAGGEGGGGATPSVAEAAERSAARPTGGASGWRGWWAWVRAWTRPGVPVVLRMPRAVVLAVVAAVLLLLAGAWGVGYLQGRSSGEREAQAVWEEQLVAMSRRGLPSGAQGLQKGRVITPASSEFATAIEPGKNYLQLALGRAEDMRRLADFLSTRGFDTMLRPRSGDRYGHQELLLLPGAEGSEEIRMVDARIADAARAWTLDGGHDYMKSRWWRRIDD